MVLSRQLLLDATSFAGTLAVDLPPYDPVIDHGMVGVCRFRDEC